jgi:hypothetical protein
MDDAILAARHSSAVRLLSEWSFRISDSTFTCAVYIGGAILRKMTLAGNASAVVINNHQVLPSQKPQRQID